MLTNDGNTEGLFRGAVMNSGSPIPVGDITNGQVSLRSLGTPTRMSSKARTHSGQAGSRERTYGRTHIALSQIWYDQLVDATGCKNNKDTLQCLREVPYDDLKAAQDNTPFVFSYQVGCDFSVAPSCSFSTCYCSFFL